MDPRHRVADRFFSDHYARLIQAMTFDQAKSILGFPPSSSPSPEEIKKVYLRMVRENHPDRGGSTEKMREINVAKDVLDGKQRPEGFAPAWRPQAAPPRDDPPPRPRWEPPKVVKTINGTSFASAVSGAVTGVEWKFISKPVYPGDAGGSQVWVAVGITAAYYVVIGVKHRETHQSFEVDAGGLVEYEEDWECNEVKVLITKPPLKALPLAIRSVCGLF